MEKKKRTQDLEVAVPMINKKNKINNHEQEEEVDRITQLPHNIIHHILSLMPLKSAVRTSILSNTWKDLWKPMWATATTLDFGAEFAGDKPFYLLSHTINRFLQLLQTGNNKTIDIFRLYFDPQGQFLPNILHWIEFAVQNGVKELDLDFTLETFELFFDIVQSRYELPPCLVSCDSMAVLRLGGYSFELPRGFRGFGSLRALHLTRVRIAHHVLDEMLLKCPMLEEFSLVDCCGSCSFVFSAADLKIKSFTLMDCHGAKKVGVFVSRLAHLQILRTCLLPDFYVLELEIAPVNFPITLTNLIELQLGVCDQYPGGLIAFFRYWNFPCLEKLVLEWIPPFCTWMDWTEEPSGCVFHRLKTITLNGFYGSGWQMMVVKFLLKKAVLLETIVLVTPKEGIEAYRRDESLSQAKPNVALLHEQLLLLPKVSTNAQIVLHEHSEDDNSLFCTHDRFIL
ncbi:hypothetical protein MRB53_013441 [Persea americana]|uniref:Uncharacterized protein n=1 Tax=Persea americana TaxID=3435 RepID=A0ACC2K844_PERAE|nr:hypothetical protein MRB53_013441 [Persea americana]